MVATSQPEMGTKVLVSTYCCSASNNNILLHQYSSRIRVRVRVRVRVRIGVPTTTTRRRRYNNNGWRLTCDASPSPLLEQMHHHHTQSLFLLLADTTTDAGYSLASYYTSLALFVISVPGLWSLIKRSVKSKVVQKTFIGEGEKKAPNQVAGEILSFFTRNNFAVSDRGETITFEGMMVPSRGQAALLTFCTCISLASVALVLTITYPDVGNNWFWLTVLSPLAGVYYWTKASRKEQIKVRMLVGEDGTLSEVIVQGDDQQVDQMRKELQLSEKGMVYVKGIFER
ncbi:cofactor assembly of complex C [Striga hermonthica]|uniref:Cofactor assembly of complex C n=1 Tax=Striga hermonthica TaxID=68872 RepID=A0A9N7P401_STRHE|nr:cofactor assembly of complex C [Striga hermonthica]